MEKEADSEYEDNNEEIERGDIVAAIYKISSFKMFALNIKPDIINREKFQYV